MDVKWILAIGLEAGFWIMLAAFLVLRYRYGMEGASAAPRALVVVRARSASDRRAGRVPNSAGVANPALEIDTPHGPARAHLHAVEDPIGALVLGHGVGGGVEAPDLVAAAGVARSARFSVALVEQPYRVAGRRSSPAATRLDAAWTACVEHLCAGELSGLPLVVGGRSAGARVACRTATGSGAVAVLCLAFPLQPPRRSQAAPSRLPELDAVPVPTLVVQGAGDPFGVPPAGAARSVVTVPGNHSLRTGLDQVEAAVRAWLPGVVT